MPSIIIDHAWGREPLYDCRYPMRIVLLSTISHSQILLRNYTYEEAYYVPMREMVESLVLGALQIKRGYRTISHVHIGYADEM